MEVGELEKLASSVRHAIETQISLANYVDRELQNFPSGSCEVASVILGLYLKAKGVEEISQVFGNRTIPNDINTANHVWLIVNKEILVDITADQFEDCQKQVIVCKESKFHNTFKKKALRPVDKTYLNRFVGKGYGEFYSKVLEQLNHT